MHWWFKQGVNFGSYLDKCSQGWVSLSWASAVCIYNTQHMLAALPLKEGGYKTKPTRPKQKYFFFFYCVIVCDCPGSNYITLCWFQLFF